MVSRHDATRKAEHESSIQHNRALEGNRKKKKHSHEK